MVEPRSPHNPTPQKITFGEMRESGCPRRADLLDRRTGQAAATASVSSSYVSEMGGGLVFANNART
jgi:hypothetical protein